MTGECDGKSRCLLPRPNIRKCNSHEEAPARVPDGSRNRAPDGCGSGQSTWHRDATAILVAYRHALRSSELVSLRWDDVDFTTGRLHVRRAKGGETAVHPISGKELRALRRLLRESERSTYIFVSERGAPLSVGGYQRMVARAGAAAGFPFLVHSHMLRHSCGYKLANDGHDTRAIQGYLGHRSIVSTQRYAALAPGRFKNFWKD
jgi:integrase